MSKEKLPSPINRKHLIRPLERKLRSNMMVQTFHVKITSKETIKPSTSTPQHLSIYKLCFMDQTSPAIYVPVLIFYPFDHGKNVFVLDKSKHLKSSLSQILTHFYPFAGKLKDNAVIECNDDGVDFIEAHVNCSVSTIFEQPDVDKLNHLMPIDIKSPLSATGPLLLVQVNSFECGGMAIGVCISHKIADASTLNAFIKAWSATALNGCISDALLPKYVLGSLCPSPDFPIPMPAIEFKSFKCVITRYVFYASKIEDLKARAASETVRQPTRVEAVVALIWKCLMEASRKNSGPHRTSVVSQPVNLRKRLNPPLPDNSVGNLVGNFLAKVEQSDHIQETELKQLVVQLRQGLEEYIKVHVRKLEEGNVFVSVCEAGQELKRIMADDTQHLYFFSSWCRVSQFYEADFGWGKPKWVTIAPVHVEDGVLVMDARDGKGIEVYLSLSQEGTTSVQTNNELLEFASINPPIV